MSNDGADDRFLVVLAQASDVGAMTAGLVDDGWHAGVATDFGTAHRLLREHEPLVALAVSGASTDEDVVALDGFLRAHQSTTWVGVFRRETLALPACRDLILNHLFDHHTAPVDTRHLAQTLGHALGHARLLAAARGNRRDVPGDDHIIGESPEIVHLMQVVRRVAKVDTPVLVTGESGSGKEVAARAIHRLSARADGPFVAVNCGAIPPSLIQSALFGYVKGAFTGAARDERGFIEAASGGTIFLDEIGDVSLDLQVNLLRFLQERTINRVGSTHSLVVDARVIAATHVRLDDAVTAGAFREDLYYRLNVLPVQVPPLRQRRSDIALLAQHFFDRFIDERAGQVRGFSQRALQAMARHDWPGNVRELTNRVRRALVMAEGRLITPEDLGLDLDERERAREALGDARGEAERAAVVLALTEANGNVSSAARRLGVSRMTLYRLIRKHEISA